MSIRRLLSGNPEYRRVSDQDLKYDGEGRSLIATDESEDETLFELNNANSSESQDVIEENGKGEVLWRRGGKKKKMEEQTYTVEEAVEAIGLGWFQLKMYFLCGVIGATDALEMMLLAVLSPVVRCEWWLTDAQVAFVTTVVFIGMACSASVVGMIGDKYGRKFTLFIVTLCIGYFGFLTSFSPTYYWLLILRGLVGMGMGGSPLSTSLLSEYIPRKYRAKLLIFGQIFWACGIMFEIFLASVVIPNIGWRWLLIFSAVPSMCSAFGLLFVPESVRFLLAAGRHDEADQILKAAAQVNGSTLPSGRLVQAVETNRGKFSDLFSPEYRRTTFQLWVLWFGMAFFYYGMVLASAEILRKYSPDGDKSHKCKCNFLSTSDYITMLLSTLGEFACMPVNWFLIDWLGRRVNAAVNMFCAAVLVLLLQVDMPRTVFTIVLFGVRGFSAAFGNLMYIYSSEIYPTTIRSLGMGTASTWARFGAMTTPFIAQVLLAHSLPTACWVYSLFCLLCSVNAFFMPIETKSRVLPQSVSFELLPPDNETERVSVSSDEDSV